MDPRTRKTLALAAAGIGLYWAGRKLLTRLYDLRGKVVLITGGSRGLGLVMAREFASHGARLALCARDVQELERARAELARRGVPALIVRCDVTDRGQVEDMVGRVRGHFGRIDVLVNNAGVIEVGPLQHMTLADFDEAMQVNYWGAVYTTLAVLPEMCARKGGRIVNISSIGGKVVVPHLLPYCASKFALTAFSEGLRAEAARDGVVVTTVCSHLMRTGSPRNVVVKGQNRLEYAWFKLGDSLPVVSISAEAAARRIVSACRRGEAEVILTLQAKLAARLYALFPDVAATVLEGVNRLLPEPGGIGSARARGYESESPVTRSVVGRLADRAAERNNEISDRPAGAAGAGASPAAVESGGADIC